jgi:pilus assembly protein Flp/PilA
MRTTIRRFVDDEAGATAVEYALVASIVALGIVGSLGPIRDSLNGIFNNAADGLE